MCWAPPKQKKHTKGRHTRYDISIVQPCISYFIRFEAVGACIPVLTKSPCVDSPVVCPLTTVRICNTSFTQSGNNAPGYKVWIAKKSLKVCTMQDSQTVWYGLYNLQRIRRCQTYNHYEMACPHPQPPAHQPESFRENTHTHIDIHTLMHTHPHTQTAP